MQARRYRLWAWFWVWCVFGAAAAVAIQGTAGWMVLALFASVAMFLYAAIARLEEPPPPPRPALPEAASTPLVFVARGRAEMFASFRSGSEVLVELVGAETWRLPELEWHRTYAVRIPPGDYQLRLSDPRSRGRENTEILDVTLSPDGWLYVEYERGWSRSPSGSLQSHLLVPGTLAIDEVIAARKQ